MRIIWGWVGVAVTCCAVGSVARADIFVADSTLDQPDRLPGDGLCETAEYTCTLRAAIQESNELPTADEIQLRNEPYLLDGRLVVDDSLRLRGDGGGESALDGQRNGSVLRVLHDDTDLLTCDSDRGGVARFDRRGRSRSHLIWRGIEIPMAVRSGLDDELWVVGFTSGVHRFAADGTNLGMLVASGTGGLEGPSDVLRHESSDGSVWALVTVFQPGGGILRFNAVDGSALGTFAAGGTGGLSGPNSLAEREGNVYVTSTSTNNVLRFGRDGEFVEAFTSGYLSTPRDLAFHGDSLYVVSEGQDAVARFDAATGDFQDYFVTSGSGGLDRPQYLAFAPDGDLYVSSSATGQVLRYDGQTGAFKRIAIQGEPGNVPMPSCLYFRSDEDSSGPIVYAEWLRIRNGRESFDNGASGLYVGTNTDVYLSDSVVEDNESLTIGGGITNYGNLTIERSAIVNNRLPAGGGGVTSTGGGIFNDGYLEIADSSITGNFATRGGGLTSQGRRASLLNVTISGNTTIGAGGGIRNIEAPLDLEACTITGNRANDTSQGSESNAFGGGLYNFGDEAYVSLTSTILAGNSDGRSRGAVGFSPDCHSEAMFAMLSNGYNLVGNVTSTCALGNLTPTDQLGTPTDPIDPMLSALTGLDGRYNVHVPLAGSPVIDGGATGPCTGELASCPTNDGTGTERPLDGDGDGDARADIGAVEYMP